MRRWGLAALLALAALAAAFLLARGDSPPGDLTGRTWHLRTVVEGGTTGVVGNDIDPTVRFDAREIHVDFGCNVGSGRYRRDGSELVLGPVAHTLKGCGAELEAIQARTLRERVYWEVEGPRLTLSRDGVVLTYVDRNRR